jgi:hypothetical protein
MTDDKVRENRLRRMAERQGLALIKSRRRDPKAPDHGRYQLVDPATGGVVSGVSPGFAIDEVETWLVGSGPLGDLTRSLTQVVLAFNAGNTLDRRTVARLAKPVADAIAAMDRAARPVSHYPLTFPPDAAEQICQAVRGILDAPPPAPPDALPFLTLRQAYNAYLAAMAELRN